MIRFTFSTEYLADLFTKSGQAIIMTDGGLDDYHNELIRIEHDKVRDHVIMEFADGSDVVTDRTITFTAMI